MILDLEIHRLQVVKQRSPRGGYIRVAVSANPDWYRRFCAEFPRTRPRWRKLKTVIERKHTLRALWRVAHGRHANTLYGERLDPFIEAYITEQLQREAYEASRPRIERRYRSPA